MSQDNPFLTGAASGAGGGDPFSVGYGAPVPGTERTTTQPSYPAPNNIFGGWQQQAQQVTTTLNKQQILQNLLMASVNDPDSVIQLQQKLIKAGLLNPRSQAFLSGDVYEGDATWSAMGLLIDKSVQTKTDWTKLLDDQVDKFRGKGAWDYYLKKFGQDGLNAVDDTGVDRTDVSRQTQLSTKMDAQGLLTQALQQNLGRDPSAQEVQAFFQALQAYQKTSAQVTTTHSEGDTETGVNTTSTTTGGANPQVFAENYSMRTENQNEVASLRGRQYVDVFERMMRGE